MQHECEGACFPQPVRAGLSKAWADSPNFLFACVLIDDSKSWLAWKDPNAGKDWGKEEKGTTEDEMVGWHHWLDALGFGWTLGVGDGQGGLACCGSWGHKESDTTGRLNWTELINDSKSLPLLWLGQKDPQRREWQPTLVFLPGKSHGWRSLAGYSPWGHQESDMTEHTRTANNYFS